MSATRVRPAHVGDAAAIASLANQHQALDGRQDDLYSARLIEDHAFGPDPAFEAVVAEHDGAVAGYATFGDMYNPDLAVRSLWVCDLFVTESARGRGIGRKLLAAVARIAVARGRASVAWGVYTANTKARRFYASLGARDEDARVLELDGAALTDLADTADTAE